MILIHGHEICPTIYSTLMKNIFSDWKLNNSDKQVPSVNKVR